MTEPARQPSRASNGDAPLVRRTTATAGHVHDRCDTAVQTWNSGWSRPPGWRRKRRRRAAAARGVPVAGRARIRRYYAEALAGEVKVLSHALHRFICCRWPRRCARTDAAGAGGSCRSWTARRVVGTITLIDDVSERVATERELRARIAPPSMPARRRSRRRGSRTSSWPRCRTRSARRSTPCSGWTRILRSRDFDKATVAARRSR